MKKVLLSIGNEEIETIFENIKGVEVVDKERDLETVKDLLEFMNIDCLIVNRLLDENGEELLDIAAKAKQRNIKVIVLLDDIEDFSEKKIITSLVAQDVYGFIRFKELKEDSIVNIINNYPDEFDFSFFNYETKKKSDKPKIANDSVPEKAEAIAVELINNAVITVYSNCSNGKSVITWLLSLCFVDRNYKTAVINIDKGYSANMFYGIDNDEYEGVFSSFGITNDAIDATESWNRNSNEFCYSPMKNLSIVCGSSGSSEELEPDQFQRVLTATRIKNNITLIDCKSEINKLTRMALQQSTVDLLVYDIDLNHYNLNFHMLEELGDVFNPEKTIVVINNAIIESESYKLTLKNIKESGLNFKDIVTVRKCGAGVYDLMFSGTTPYFDKNTNDEFKKDIDALLDSLKSKKSNEKFLKKVFKFRR